MILRIDAHGPGSDQISYKIGNHPGRQLIRRESEALGRLWFPVYEDEKTSFVLHVRSNIPPIPNRLLSSSIRYREWHRFAEWVNSFLGKTFKDPDPTLDGQESPEYRVQVGVLPRPIEHDEALKQLFKRVGLTVREPSGGNEVLKRWLRLQTDELSFSELLSRIAILVPCLYGAHRSELDTGGYAGLLEKLRGTWFNVHPDKEFLAHRFLSLQESTTSSGEDDSPVSVRDQREQFKHWQDVFGQVGEQIARMVEVPWTSEEQEMWIVNSRDGTLLKGVDNLIDEFPTHFVEGSQDALKRLEQRISFLSREEAIQADIEQDNLHWCPAGFQNPQLDRASIILWSPRAGELQGDIIEEAAYEMMAVHAPDRLVAWAFSDGSRVWAPEGPTGTNKDTRGSSVSSWRETWETVARDAGYSPSWNEVDVQAADGVSDGALIGRFTR